MNQEEALKTVNEIVPGAPQKTKQALVDAMIQIYNDGDQYGYQRGYEDAQRIHTQIMLDTFK